MKKIAILFSVAAFVLVLASCASQTKPTPAADTTAPAASSHHHHGHDYKGET